MPEPYWPKKKSAYTLKDAEKNGSLVRIWCRYCKLERWYLLAELRIVFGNIECDDVIYSRRFKCTGCGSKDTLDMHVGDPPAGKRQSMTLRRIDRIENVRKVIWRDEPPVDNNPYRKARAR